MNSAKKLNVVEELKQQREGGDTRVLERFGQNYSSEGGEEQEGKEKEEYEQQIKQD